MKWRSDLDAVLANCAESALPDYASFYQYCNQLLNSPEGPDAIDYIKALSERGSELEPRGTEYRKWKLLVGFLSRLPPDLH